MRRLIAPVAALALLAACQQADEPVSPPAGGSTAPQAPEGGLSEPEPTPTASPPTPGLLPGTEVGSCAEERGQEAAQALVDRCIQVSPATRPPCNTANPCALIQGEIDRSCALWEDDDDVPEECTA